MTEEPFREELRYEYDLTPDSIVLDCGGYEGTFAEKIATRYDCHVHVLEPVPAFYERTRDRLAPLPKVRVYPFGIGSKSEDVVFTVKGDMTGVHADAGDKVKVSLVDVWTVMLLPAPRSFDLVKLNIEGGEFGVIRRLIEVDAIRRCKNLQVQWHPVFNSADMQRDCIMEKLSRTHELTWDYGWTWQNWRVKP